MNKEYIIFSSIAGKIAEKKFKAGIGHEEAEAFVKTLYEEYEQSDMPVPDINWIGKPPSPVTKWISNILTDKFLFMESPPVWIGEASWRFIDNKPMVFINQIEFTDNETMQDHVSTGEIVYTFAGRKKTNEGWELVIKIIKQSKYTSGTTYIY